MRLVSLATLSLLAVLAVAMGWQHFRYLDWRRTAAQDHQPLLHSSSVFHVISYLRLEPGDDLVESLAKTRRTLEGAGGSQWIYAGKVVLMGLRSSQLGDVQWDAIVMSQYDSREAYDAVARSNVHNQAFAHFDATYHHGMQRSAALNLAMPMIFLGFRVADILKGVSVIDPYDRASDEDLAGRNLAMERINPAIEAARAYNEKAAVVFNLARSGSAAEQEANRAYGRKMVGLFAANGHGPSHIGKSVTIEGDAEFEDVNVVYYPGIDYLISLMRSKFYNGIVGDKQLGDTQAIPTVPILDRL
ncbi:MAG: hypothetical protein GY723_03650 [bacterium]|nr:hypothetical protein [bacterium]